jgi:hypothetical protein
MSANRIEETLGVLAERGPRGEAADRRGEILEDFGKLGAMYEDAARRLPSLAKDETASGFMGAFLDVAREIAGTGPGKLERDMFECQGEIIKKKRRLSEPPAREAFNAFFDASLKLSKPKRQFKDVFFKLFWEKERRESGAAAVK